MWHSMQNTPLQHPVRRGWSAPVPTAKFWKVSVPVHLLYKGTVENTFENACLHLRLVYLCLLHTYVYIHTYVSASVQFHLMGIVRVPLYVWWCDTVCTMMWHSMHDDVTWQFQFMGIVRVPLPVTCSATCWYHYYVCSCDIVCMMMWHSMYDDVLFCYTAPDVWEGLPGATCMRPASRPARCPMSLLQTITTVVFIIRSLYYIQLLQ